MSIVPCKECGQPLSTEEDGTPGAELYGGQWVCSEVCWEMAALSPQARKKLIAAAEQSARDGLLPALRKLRDSFAHYISERDWGNAITLNYDSDAALLELAGVPGAMSPGQATSAGSAPASWCSQCGQDLSAPACGPTHALRANELAGIKGGDEAAGEHGRRTDSIPVPVNEEAGAQSPDVVMESVPERRAPSSHRARQTMQPVAPASSLPHALVRGAGGHCLICGAAEEHHVQAAEPAEHEHKWKRVMDGVMCSGCGAMSQDVHPLVAQIKRNTLLDAARDLREWADERKKRAHKVRQDDADSAAPLYWEVDTIEECAYRLKARAKDIGETQGVADDRPAGAPSELDIAYNRGLIEAVKIARSHMMLVPTASAIGEKGRVYQTAWDGACNRIADDIEAKVKL